MNLYIVFLIFIICCISNITCNDLKMNNKNLKEKMIIGHQHLEPKKGKILMVAANKIVSPKTGWTIGFWFAEVSHACWEFDHAGYSVDIVSPYGGDLYIDDYSDPENPSKYSAYDFLSLGFKKDKQWMNKLMNTTKLSNVNLENYDAIFVAGGLSPMFTIRGNKDVQNAIVHFYTAKKPTCVICHGTSVLLDTKLPNGKLLVQGKTWTGFANVEEEYARSAVGGMELQPFYIETEAKKIKNTKFITKPLFSPFAIRDGNLITGQQQYSTHEAARLVIELLEK